jgi:hypothetical protein
MCDIIGNYEDLENDTENDPPYLVLMDHALEELSPKNQLQNDALHKAIFEAGLTSLAALHEEKLVHTGMVSIA